MHEKLEHLRDMLKSCGKLAIAFSGGVDSSFLLYTASTLPVEILAVTATSASFPERELDAASSFAKKLGVPHIVIESEELDLPGFAENPPDRCYLCKFELFSKMKKAASERGIEHIAEASNADDVSDYRPGLKAIRELGILSPLREAGLTKSEIRLLSREAGLPTWDKPSFACLASRFPYGEAITRQKLGMVDRAEEYLLKLGFTQVRVRHHGDIARIEVLPEEMPALIRNHADGIAAFFKTLGFKYVTLDIQGYRTGSMNETLPLKADDPN
jgi:uncharacterized protein